MLQFGRMDAHQAWAGCGVVVIEAALGLLRRAFLGDPDAPGETEIFVDRVRVVPNVAAPSYRLDVDRPAEADLPDVVDWASQPTRRLGGPCLRCVVVDLEDRPLAGLLVRAERIYRLADLCRALEASFDTGLNRPGRFAVLDSNRIPLATVATANAVELARPLAAFHCDNPICPTRGQRVLVGLEVTEFYDHQNWRMGAWAYPCPSCPGEDEWKWALTFDEVPKSEGRTALARVPFLRYPVHPFHRRVIPCSGPMNKVVGRSTVPRWGTAWNPDQIEPLSPALLRCLGQPRLPLLMEAANEGGRTGSLAASLLDPGNLRALVEHCRQLPVEKKRTGLAHALAAAYYPRRQAAFKNDDDTGSAAERYHYIAYSPHGFLGHLRYFGLTEHMGRFLDVGCGIGEKLFLAYALGRFQQCDGLEINERSLGVAEFLFASIATDIPYPVQLIPADALAFDRYGDYEVIYMYRPFRNPLRMGELLRQIAGQLQPGAMTFDVFDRTVALRCEEDGLYEPDPAAKVKARWTGPIELNTFLQERRMI